MCLCNQHRVCIEVPSWLTGDLWLVWVKQWELLHPQVGTTPFPLWLWGCSPEVIISTHWKGAEHHWGQMPRGDTSQQQPQLQAGGKGGLVTLVSWLRDGCWTPGATARGCYPMQLIYIKRNEAVLAPPMLRPVCEEEMSHPGGERQQQPGPVSAWIAQALPLPCSLCCVPSHCSWENTNGGFVPQSPSGLKHEHKISALTLLSRISPNSGPLTQLLRASAPRASNATPQPLAVPTPSLISAGLCSNPTAAAAPRLCPSSACGVAPAPPSAHAAHGPAPRAPGGAKYPKSRRNGPVPRAASSGYGRTGPEHLPSGVPAASRCSRLQRGFERVRGAQPPGSPRRTTGHGHYHRSLSLSPPCSCETSPPPGSSPPPVPYCSDSAERPRSNDSRLGRAQLLSPRLPPSPGALPGGAGGPTAPGPPRRGGSGGPGPAPRTCGVSLSPGPGFLSALLLRLPRAPHGPRSPARPGRSHPARPEAEGTCPALPGGR